MWGTRVLPADPAGGVHREVPMRRTTKALTTALAAVVFPALALAAEGGVTLPAGTALHVRLTTTLTSKTNKTGDKFSGMVEKPVIVNGKTIVPDGSFIDGHVAFIKPSKRIKGRAEM